jgi:hypothetical protein
MMIKQIKELDEALKASLVVGLADLIAPGNICTGYLPKTADPVSISIICAGFKADERDFGNLDCDRRDEVMEEIIQAGDKRDFSLSYKPLPPLIGVQSSTGSVKRENEDYIINYNQNIISFRNLPSPGETMQVRYYAYTKRFGVNLKFLYSIIIWAQDPQKQDQFALEVVKTLCREKTVLEKKGINDIKLVRVFSKVISRENDQRAKVARYQIEATVDTEPSKPQAEVAKEIKTILVTSSPA